VQASKSESKGAPQKLRHQEGIAKWSEPVGHILKDIKPTEHHCVGIQNITSVVLSTS
jgi:hypothetical protein